MAVHPRRLDSMTVDRLVAGRVDPADAPPGYRRLATLLAEATRTADRPGGATERDSRPAPQGTGISGTAHDPELTGLDKGAAVSASASDGQSRAGHTGGGAPSDRPDRPEGRR